MNIKEATQIKKNQISFMSEDSPLLPKQQVAASWMSVIKKALLLDDMGTGKTYSTLGALQLISKTTIIKAALFCPGAVISQWVSTIEELLGWKVVVHEGSLSKRKIKFEYFNSLNENSVFLTSYSRPLHDRDDMKALDVNCWILDEATFAKNPETEIYKLLITLFKEEDYTFLLTGTPTALSLGDLYWLFNLLNIQGVVDSFEQEVEPLLNKRGAGRFETIVGAEDFKGFISKISPWMLHRSLDAVIDDGPISYKGEMTFNVVPLKISESQVNAFNDLKAAANRDSRVGIYKPLKYYSMFNMVCSSPQLIDKDDYFNPKIEFLISTIKSSQGKFIVFVRYLAFQKIINKALQEEGISTVLVSGEFSQEEQVSLIEEFKSMPSLRCLLMTDIGKFGLNLQVANNVVFLSLPRNPADFVQIIGRVRRYGQDNEVKAYLIFMENTIEEDALRDLYGRQRVHDSLFNETDFAKFFKREDDYVRGFLEKDYK